MRKIFSILSVFICFLFISADKPKVCVYMIGDSTMSIKKENKYPETGWGVKIASFFNDNILFENHAQNGRSTVSFRKENRWNPILEKIKPGDWVFIQFGHNDEPKEGKVGFTPLSEFKANLERYVTEAREKGANPVLFTPVTRRRFDENSNYFDTHKQYPGVIRALAKEMNVPLIDMHSMSIKLIVEYGEEASKSLYLWEEPGHPNYPEGVKDDTHFCEKGAEEMAKLCVQAIREQHVELENYLRP